MLNLDRKPHWPCFIAQIDRFNYEKNDKKLELDRIKKIEDFKFKKSLFLVFT